MNTQKYPIKFLLSRILMYLGISKYFIIDKKIYKIRFYPTPTSALLWINSDYKKEDELFFQHYLRKDDNVIDVGANIGWLTILASKIIGEYGSVFSIEAHPKIFHFLKGNIALNNCNNVVCFNTAIDKKIGTVSFSNYKWDELNSVILNNNPNSKIVVSSSTLDSLPINKQHFALLKIDVEGFEKFVILGAKNILTKTNCVYFEYNDNHFKKYHYSGQELLNIFISYKFKLYKFSSQNTLCSLSSNYFSTQTENILAIRNNNDFVQRTGYFIQ